jgi:ribonuclease D
MGIEMISTQHDLEKIVARARQTDSVGLDTEFVWERTYYPRLGLIQLALSDEDCHLIDPVAIKDLSPLGALLADKSVIKILHDAPQDLAILSRVTRSDPQNVFDTQVAAGFSGLPSTISLGDLILVLLDIKLSKSETRTNWLSRPLAQEQVDYALDDVRYLRAIRILLLTRIIVPEIKIWLQEELDLLNTPGGYNAIEDYDRFSKIKGAARLDRASLAVLQELAAWREREARKIDRPRGHVITDKALLGIVRQKITNLAGLEQSGLLSAKKFKRYGQSIITRTKHGLATPDQDYPGIKRPVRLSVREKELFDRLQNFIRLKCEMQGLDPQLVGTISELRQLAKNLNNPGSPLPPHLTYGWRKTFLEEFFRQRT